jgi:tetratricopeptide (TPR) repeat protein/transcriptional regulator with XRE-family HTH domain
MPGSAFGEELERLLTSRGLSWRGLADQVGYTPSWLSKVKNGTPPSAELARRCDQVLDAGGRLMALATEAVPARPAQLPASAARFVGRERELGQLCEALMDEHQLGTPAVVAVDGSPGVGKTALALKLAHDVASVFPDGQLYVDLRGYSPDGVPARPAEVLGDFLAALGVATDSMPAERDQRAKLFRSLVNQRRLLIVLDNAADSAQVEPLLPGSGQCAVIVTSRRRLSGMAMRTNARQVTLGPMTDVESRLLLRNVIGDDRADAEPAAITALARHCAHLPLALRIAAERVATHPHHPVDELIEELDADEHRLDGLATDDSLAVRSVFSWSYRDLSTESARMFRLLGVFRRGQISTPAAAALAGVSPVRGRRLMERLASVHLVEGVERDRYRMHDLLHVYAAELVRSEETEQSRREAAIRLTDWYLRTAERANEVLAPFRVHTLEVPSAGPTVTPLDFDTPVAALRWCDGEVANLLPVMETALAYGLTDTAWRLCIASWDYFRLRMPMGVWVATHELAAHAARTAGDRFAESWVQTNLAVAKHRLHDFAAATELYEQALATRREIGDCHGEAWSLAGLGLLAVDRRDADAAQSTAEQALALFRDLGDRHGEVTAMATLGEVRQLRGDHHGALVALHEALRVAQDSDDAADQAETLLKIAAVYLADGQAGRALDSLDRALVAARDVRNRMVEANALFRRGVVLRELDRVDEARESLGAALELYEEVDDHRAGDVRAELDALGVSEHGSTR